MQAKSFIVECIECIAGHWLALCVFALGLRRYAPWSSHINPSVARQGGLGLLALAQRPVAKQPERRTSS